MAKILNKKDKFCSVQILHRIEKLNQNAVSALKDLSSAFKLFEYRLL